MERTRRVRTNTQVAQDTTLLVTSSQLGVENDKRKVLEVRQFMTDPTFVRVSAGVTKNLGNYESLRVDVSITAPCYTEEVEQVQPRIAEMVARMLDEEVEQYLSEGK